MKTFFKTIIPAAALALTMGFSSCADDLHVDPINPNLTTNVEASQLFNKCYANMIMQGNGGANGDCDIVASDGGSSTLVRQLFNHNELTTDEAICGWNDPSISALDYNTYDASADFTRILYYRLFFGIPLCNQYIQKFGNQDATKTAEVRFLRALFYYELMDCFGNPPFTLDASGSTPKQIKRADLFKWLETELKEIEPQLSDAKPKTSSEAGYGRVDKAAAWLLLARMYLNAEVYTGTPRWADAQTYAKKVMDSPYKLYTAPKKDPSGRTWSAYQQLFMGDNGENGASVEAIFPLLQDGLKTTAWGGSAFFIASTTDDKVHIKDANTAGTGITEQWGGNRMRPELVAKFFPKGDAPQIGAYAMPEAAGDDRAIFDGEGRLLDNVEVGTFNNGFAVCKFVNFKTDGTPGHNSQFPDADYFFMRSAEAYLIYAEADARLHGNNTTSKGTDAINALRKRAHASTRTGANASYSLDDICDEWSREFYFEGLRRPTLVRFGRFGGNTSYTWTWKGGVKAGGSFAATKNIFPIPSNDKTVNGNLIQNPGY